MIKDLTTQQDNAALISVLQASLYPGAKAESVELAVAYCKAAGYDIMQKPVHIVPMPIKTGRKKPDGYDEEEWRDVIMTGVGLYRIQAARTGQYAGITEPEFGPDMEFTPGGLVFPQWARCTVKRRLPCGLIAEFTAMEFWLENYASKKGGVPNAMWNKRPRGQLAKCVEAQALRKAFPEVGSAPTFEEMEGKLEYDDAPVIAKPTQTIAIAAEPEPLPPCDPAKFAELLPQWKKLIAEGTKTADAIIENLSKKYTLTDDQKSAIKGEPTKEAAE